MPSLRTMLEREEARVPYAYKDSRGLLTIGVGRLIDKAKGGGLSDEEIDLLLDNDIKRCTAEITAALPWTDGLDEVRLAVLVGMAFQLGINGLLGFVQTLAAVHYGKYADAARLMLESRWAEQTPERAKRMSRQMETGEWQ